MSPEPEPKPLSYARISPTKPPRRPHPMCCDLPLALILGALGILFLPSPGESGTVSLLLLAGAGLVIILRVVWLLFFA